LCKSNGKDGEEDGYEDEEGAPEADSSYGEISFDADEVELIMSQYESWDVSGFEVALGGGAR
jgi:hypothetical protein